MADEVEAVLNIPVEYDNAPFEKPTDSIWIRLSITTESDRQTDVGAKLRRFRTIGAAVASVRTPINQGDLEGVQTADSIAEVFRGVTFQGVTFLTPVVQPLGRVGKEWVVDVRCPFQTDNFF